MKITAFRGNTSASCIRSLRLSVARLLPALACAAGVAWLCVATSAIAEQPAGKKQPVTLLTFRLQLNRMTPQSMTVPKGRYLLRLENGIVTGREVTYSITREGQTDKKQAAIPTNGVRSQVFMDLTPGTYVLEAGGREDWRAQIVVTNGSSK